MDMGAPIRMPTETPALLTLVQWLSPAFPVGAFSYSHGLETAVEAGEVADANSFQNWLGDILQYGAGRNDAILLVAAYHAPDESVLEDIDAMARALAPSRERLAETVQQGDAFSRTASNIWSARQRSASYPVAVGAAAREMGLPLHDTLQFFLHGFAGNLTSAAIRLVPLGQTAGHAALATMAPLCAGIAARAQTQTLDDLGACAFMGDIASMKHETEYSRLFQS